MKTKLNNTTEPQHNAKLPVVRAVCEHKIIKNVCEFPYGQKKVCQDCGKDFTN